MGFVHNAGPPPISSAEVARQLQQIYSEALHVIEGHYLSVVVRQKKENVATMQGRASQGQPGSTGPSSASGPKSGDAPPHAPVGGNNQPPFSMSASNGGAPPINMGGFTLDQLNKLAMASSAQLASYNLSPEQLSIIQRHRATLINAYQQKAGGMRPPGTTPAIPSNGPNAKGEWVVKGRVITPHDYEKGKQIVAKMYNTHIASIRKLLLHFASRHWLIQLSFNDCRSLPRASSRGRTSKLSEADNQFYADAQKFRSHPDTRVCDAP